MLGWSNTAKIAALETKLKHLNQRMCQVGEDYQRLKAEQTQLADRLRILARLDEFVDFQELDWGSVAREVEARVDERRCLAEASDVLRQLEARLKEAVQAQDQGERELAEARDKRSRLEQRLSDSSSQKAETLATLEAASGDPALAPRLEAWCAEALGQHVLSVESCDHREQELRTWLQGRIDAEQKKLERLAEKILKAMVAFNEEFKQDTAEIDASLEAAHEYQRLLDQLDQDDLPRFVARFKELLNINTINEIANFNGQLSRERETIRERIGRINQSLAQIDYSPGRYIVLESQASPDPEVRDFQAELRACTEGVLGGPEDGPYSEAKFMQVKAIIDRFRGREGTSELDQRWTDKVTDVRNWFTFAASERWHADGSEHDHYSDSGGKSGGQKEKLAYTILAASLAYQFGLEWGAERSRSFHFVAIDEAFGRGSDESARFGLALFRQLNLQFLIVTPLQKIQVIEPFVSSVGFVHNEDGRSSRLRNLTIEEYREQKGLHDARTALLMAAGGPP